MKRTILMAGGMALALGLAGTASAQMTMLSAKLDGKAGGDPKGSGDAMVHVDAAKNQVCYELHVKDVTATMAHIHKGAAGASGPVAVPFKAPDASGKSEGCADASPDLVKDMIANPGNYYVNVHSADFKAGAIRGQLTK